LPRTCAIGPGGLHKLEYSGDGRRLAVLNGNGIVGTLRLGTAERK
jgi:hypothetical protein